MQKSKTIAGLKLKPVLQAGSSPNLAKYIVRIICPSGWHNGGRRMDLTIEDKRQAVARAYSGRAWREKVDKMTDPQVIAIYFRLKAQNKI
jgi:hypothetical protein